MHERTAASVTEIMNELPLEELEKFENKWVAWTMDGTRIIAGADDISDLEPAVKAAGLNMSEVVFEFIPPLDMAYLGAGG